MPFRQLPPFGVEYALLSYDAEGRERTDEPGGLISRRTLELAASEPFTDVFIFIHGWRGDLPAAVAQYDRWMGALLGHESDRQRAQTAIPNFRPLLIGLHWPSEPWGEEEFKEGSFAAMESSPQALIDEYVERLGDKPEIRECLQVIVQEARHNAAADKLTDAARVAYNKLNEALELDGQGPSAPPDADREPFDPDEAFDATNEEEAAFGEFNLGGLLGPLKMLSYWTMKKRGRTIGEGGMHQFLNALQAATPARIHLMGHSFGTVVVSSILGGPQGTGVLRRPVDSVALIQGALSLWSYSPTIPFDGAGPGYFSSVLARGKIKGPLVTTRSRFDRAVGFFYPLASRMSRAVAFAADYPKYGGIGSFGIQGLAEGTKAELKLPAKDAPYDLQKGRVYNFEAAQFICAMEGVSGAHSDIAGPEVAHLIWSTALASL